MTDELTAQQKENIRRIVLIARKHTARHIKEASPADAILIANRAAQQEQYFIRQGVSLDEPEDSETAPRKHQLEVMGTNTYGKNVFREVRVHCQECDAKTTTNMQCDTGTYQWDCETCGESTPHVVTEVSPKQPPR
jgi:hypothetical protein